MTIGLVTRIGPDLVIGCDSRVSYGGEVEVAQKALRTPFGVYVGAGSAGWWHRARRAIQPSGYQSIGHAMDTLHDAMVGVAAPAGEGVSMLAAVRTEAGLAAIYADHTGDVREVGDFEAIGCSLAARVAWPLMPDAPTSQRALDLMAHIGQHLISVGPPYRVWRVTPGLAPIQEVA